MEQLTLEKISEQLLAEGFISAEQQQEILSSMKPQSVTPWYIHALIAVAAWFSTVLLIIFLFLTLFQNVEDTVLILGILTCTIAVILNKQKKDSMFFNQVSLVLNMTGQFLVMVGVGIMFRDINPEIAIGTSIIVLQITMCYFYRHAVQYFMMPIFISCATFFLLSGSNSRFWNQSPEAMQIVIAMLTVATGYSWYKQSSFGKYRFFHYSLYGMALSLLGMVSVSAFPELYDVNMWWVSGVVLTLALLLLEITLLENLASTAIGIFIVIVSLLFCVLMINSPALIAGIFVLVLGFYRGDKLLMLVSCLYFAGFLFFFYYSLETTLLNKSLVLMGSGALLAILSIVVDRFELEVKNA
ncbi:DUF4401 domain-containing protein [Candidatus Uabimicrobium sp. HlEnr_7]|uniref:DUF4401 domain-containing protein n=1 Tax=Candidatus Uabimicrobium helgolandensis TaxID=3095367 RepID=UPI0035575031